MHSYVHRSIYKHISRSDKGISALFWVCRLDCNAYAPGKDTGDSSMKPYQVFNRSNSGLWKPFCTAKSTRQIRPYRLAVTASTKTRPLCLWTDTIPLFQWRFSNMSKCFCYGYSPRATTFTFSAIPKFIHVAGPSSLSKRLFSSVRDIPWPSLIEKNE